jgi:energy-coupling factor transporter ATP-binding protein EcfA2
MNAVTISSIEFRNFKAFSHFSVRLQHMNILVGPNNSGKSTILSAFRVLAAGLRRARAKNPEFIEGPKGHCHGYSLSGEALPISIENVHTDLNEIDTHVLFRLSNGNNLRLFFPRDGGVLLIPEPTGRMGKGTSGFKQAFPISIGVVPVLGPVEHGESVLQDETIRTSLATHRASRHFRNYWWLYPEGFDDFADLLRKTWPGMDIERPQKVGTWGENLAMLCIENRIPRELFWAGFGFQIWCQLLTHITRARGDTILVIDEPEIYLHPDVQRQLLGILRDSGPDIVLATHSAEIMGEADPSEIVVIEKMKQSGERLKDFEGVQAALNVLGSVQNITLTQLARNRRVLFVEGMDDFRIIRRFASKLGFTALASGLDITPVESGGLGNWEKLPALAWGIEKALGTPLRLGAVFDRDYFCAEEIDQILAKLKQSLETAHFHARKEIENYLLTPAVLDRALSRCLDERSQRTGEQLKLKEPTMNVLDRITNNFRSEAQGQYIAKRNLFFRHLNRDPASITTETIQQFEKLWGDLNRRVEIVPGKDTLRAFREYVHAEYGTTITDYRIISEFKRDEIPADMKQLVSDLDTFRSGTGTLLT